ncbi:hypothetical protein Gotur_013216 [Gossypium turneri]
MNNEYMRHSWLIYFKYDTQFKFPNWFQEWWNCLNQTKNTFTGQSIFSRNYAFLGLSHGIILMSKINIPEFHY